MSLHCKLVPVQYRESEYGLLCFKREGGGGGGKGREEIYVLCDLIVQCQVDKKVLN